MKEKNYLTTVVKYQDILFNWYTQKITIEIDKIQHNKSFSSTAKIKTTIDDEELKGKKINLNIE